MQRQALAKFLIIAYTRTIGKVVRTMLEAISLDPKTIIVKSDNTSDLSEVINFIAQKEKRNNLNSFLDFASKNKVIDGNYKFNRDDCYES
jgi:hypothetical protein